MSSVDRIEIAIARQQLRTFNGAQELRCYRVSSARNGVGEMLDSECTPRGCHEIAEKIGADCAANTVFVARRVDTLRVVDNTGQPLGSLHLRDLLGKPA